jgi:drug/metabolite transporter (DMT)-like permease
MLIDRRWLAYAALAAAIAGMSWSALFVRWAGVPAPASASGRTWVALFALGFISQLASYYALVYALGHLPATITSVAVIAQVPLAALLAAALLGEPLTVAQMAGGAVVLGGIYVVSKPPSQRELIPLRRPRP